MTNKNGNISTSKKSGTKKISSNGPGRVFPMADSLSVQKTYKLYIGGKFPRTESGRYIKISDGDGHLIANVCRGSRKDFRNAVVAARQSQKAWEARSAYNKGQIVYRIAEMLEGRKNQFIEEFVSMGYTKRAATKELEQSIDRIVYYAGWSDKYQQIFSSVNPVASSHFNFTVLEPMGVVSIFTPNENALLGLVSTVIPSILAGNTCIALASEDFPISAISFAEVLQTSDLPGGVINILTGIRTELIDHASLHKDVNAFVYCGDHNDDLLQLEKNSTENLKRIIPYKNINWKSSEGESPYYINDVCEYKTTWHPIGS